MSACTCSSCLICRASRAIGKKIVVGHCAGIYRYTKSSSSSLRMRSTLSRPNAARPATWNRRVERTDRPKANRLRARWMQGVHIAYEVFAGILLDCGGGGVKYSSSSYKCSFCCSNMSVRITVLTSLYEQRYQATICE